MFNFDDYDDIIHRHRFAYWSASIAAQRGHTGFTVRAGKEMIEAALFGGGALFEAGALFETGTTPVGRSNLWNNLWNNLLNVDLPNGLPPEDPLNGDWPEDFQRFMAWHREKRERMIQAIQAGGIFAENDTPFVPDPNDEDLAHFHGRAAKLINVYMKAFLFSEINDQARLVVHPPVDFELLKGLRDAIIDRNNNGNPIAYAQDALAAILRPLHNQPNRVIPWTQLTSAEYEAIIRQFHRLTNGVGLWKIEKFWTPPIN
ncbi:MAG: hypothetical protein OXD44_00250 [Gammaproteobacteria bacterium]|nr:hypothetical protein [Gammaproteobacteria bacterium]